MTQITYTTTHAFTVTHAEYVLIRELYRPENPAMSTRRLVASRFLREQYRDINLKAMDLKKAVDICDAIGGYVRKNDLL